MLHKGFYEFSKTNMWSRLSLCENKFVAKLQLSLSMAVFDAVVPDK